MAFRLQPGSADIPFNRGCAKAQLNLLPDAIGDFRAAIDRAPNFAEAYYSCGMAQFTMRNYDDAIKSFDKYISLEPNRPEGYVRRGISNAKLGHYSAAIQDDDCAIKLDPANVEAVNNRNWATDLQCDEDMENQTEPRQQSSHGAQPDGEKAEIPSETSHLAAQARKIAALDQSIASTPTAEAYCQRGLLFLNQSKSAEAMSDFDRAIELNPKSAASYLSRGLGYYQLSQFDKAIADYSKAIFYDAENASAYYRRGLAFDRRRKYALAASDYDNAATLNPARAAVYTALANTDRRLIARDNASSDISTTAVRTIPATQRTQSVNRSKFEEDAFSKLKAWKDQSAPESPFRSHPAQTGGQAQQNRSPNSTSSTNSLPGSQPLAITDGEAAYKQAKEAQWACRWEVAISEFIALLKANSVPKKTSWIYHNLGQCYEQLGKIEDSMTCYNRGLQVNPREVTTLVSRGQLYWSHYHDYQRALADVNLALSIRPTWPEAIKFKNELDLVRTGAAR
jgi:tetratricopeptide (TPR) repeat protein